MFSFKKKQFTPKKKSCVAIVPAAGSSSRMKEHGDKIFSEIRGVPVIALTLMKLQGSPLIDEIIIPTREESILAIYDICKEFSLDKVKSVIKGGKTRAESVYNGILESKLRFDLIAVHDAARPFVSSEIIDSTISAASRYSAAAPAVPLKDTVKEANGGIVVKTIPRNTLFAVQTPQVFDSSLITAALKKALDENIQITDDCSAAEAIGTRIFLTKGDYFNIKITTPEDLIFAEAISSAETNEV